MALIISYIAKILMLIVSMVLYVYLFSAIIPRFIMKLSCKKENTRDRGIKKFKYPNGRCVLYEPEFSVRDYISNYALYTENGYKYVKCKISPGISALKYDVYAFDNQNELIDIITVLEVVGDGEFTESVLLPPETSYVRLVLRKADDYSSNEILVHYTKKRMIICASVVAAATAIESIIIYSITKDFFENALGAGRYIYYYVNSSIGMTFLTLINSAIAAGLTFLAYRRNCKKVINK